MCNAVSFAEVPKKYLEFPGCQMSVWVTYDVHVYGSLKTFSEAEEVASVEEIPGVVPGFPGISIKYSTSSAEVTAEAVAKKLEDAGFSLYWRPVICPTSYGAKDLHFSILYEYQDAAAGRRVERYNRPIASAEQVAAAPETIALETAAVKDRLEREGNVILETHAEKVKMNYGEEWWLEISYISPAMARI
jgi:hypothetical protein